MLSLRTSRPAPPRGTVHFRGYLRLGTNTDAAGKRWDVGAYGTMRGGQSWASMVPTAGLHPYFSDTSGASYGLVSQAWHPYLVEYVDEV